MFKGYMKGFFNLISASEFKRLLLDFEPIGAEEISLKEALGRVVARPISSPEDLPPFSRSTMDGFAVRARDCFGASESEPSLLTVIGEVRMGEAVTDISVSPGKAVRIWTGGKLPVGADAVVMLEYTRQLDPETIEVFRPVAPYENVIEKGQDYGASDLVIPSGAKLRAQELGVLAALGILKCKVRKRPLAVIISTGDELVPEWQSPPPGKIRDINSTTLSALLETDGCRVVRMGIVGDSYEAMLTACNRAIDMGADLILVSGGSSVGNRDFTLKVFEDTRGAQVLAHGVSIRPGKPTILAKRGNCVLFGLPGHVASAMVVYWVFVRFALCRLLGTDPERGLTRLGATCAEPFPSVIGREDYIRVVLEGLCQGGEKKIFARPVHGRSGLISTLVKADGLLVIPRDIEGFHQGEEAEVILFP